METGFLGVPTEVNLVEDGAREKTAIKVYLFSERDEMKTLVLPPVPEGNYTFPHPSGKGVLPFNVVAVEGKWILRARRDCYLCQKDPATGKDRVLGKQLAIARCLFVEIVSGGERYAFYAEPYRKGDEVFLPYYFEDKNEYTIGRKETCDVCYSNPTVSRAHATLRWTGSAWEIIDTNSSFGVYVNGRKMPKAVLAAGDSIFIMGLFLIVGVGFISLNNSLGRVRIGTPRIRPIQKMEDVYYSDVRENAVEAPLFDRTPRKLANTQVEDIEIESPPMPLSANKVPLLLRLGSPMLMGGRSLMTGNYLMAISSMVLPSVTQGLTEKDRKEYEEKRQAKYQEYLLEKEQEIEREKRREEEVLNYNNPALSQAIQFAFDRRRLWERRKYDADFLRVRIGTGSIPLLAGRAYNQRRFSLERDDLEERMYDLAEREVTLENVGIDVDLREDYVIGLSGRQKDCLDLACNMILGLSLLHSYDEVKIVVLANPQQQRYLDHVRFLPHNWSNDRSLRFFAGSQGGTQAISEFLNREIDDLVERQNQRAALKKPAYVILALDKTVYDSVEWINRIFEQGKYIGISLITAFSGMPKECTKIISLGERGQVIDLMHPEKENQPFSVERVASGDRGAALNMLYSTKLRLDSASSGLPSLITFMEMFRAGRVEHLNVLKRWADNDPVKSLAAPVGVGTEGQLFALDLHEKKQGPHGLIAGMTGSGKSEFIITYILSMAVNYSPDEVAFILIDYKGGGLADAFEDKARGIHLPHLVGTITNLDGAAIARSLVSINSELKRRQEVFKRAKSETGEGTMDIYDYQRLFRSGRVSEPMPHLFIISDEFAELKSQQPEFMDELISAARIGRSLGVHLILATQKPGGVVNNQIWSNTKFRVCLKVQDRGDSMEMLKRHEAAELKQTGRFYLQVGYNEYFAMGQSAWCGAAYVPTDEVIAEKDESIRFVDEAGQTLLDAKPKTEKLRSEGKQIVSIVKYLSDLAKRENIPERKLWKDPLPPQLNLEDILEQTEIPEEGMQALIGIADDPEMQRQLPLFIDLMGIHHMLVPGNSGSGKSTLLQTMLYSLMSRYSPEEFNYYILDLSNGALGSFANMPHCGAYLTENGEADFFRLLDMIKEMIGERKKRIAEAGVTTFEAYSRVSRIPLVLVILDGYTNITAFKRASEISTTIHEYLRDAAGVGIRFILSCNHMNEVGARAKQEIDYRIALRAKDRYELGDMLEIRCRLTPAEVNGRGVCVYEGRPLEYQVARLDCDEEEQARSSRLRERLDRIAAQYAHVPRAKSLPMIDDGQTYEDFASAFETGRIPLGYSRQDMKKVALPLQQFTCLPIYFGNPLGIRPVYENLLYACWQNRMKVIVVRRKTDSVFAGLDTDPVPPGLRGQIDIIDCTAEKLEELDKLLLEEIRARNRLRDEYCEQNGIPLTVKGRVKKAAKYIREKRPPIMVLFEGFAEFAALEKENVLQGEFQEYLTRTKGYQMFFIAGFYPEDEPGLGNHPLIQAVMKEEMHLSFGGRYDRFAYGNLPMDYRRVDRVNAKYDRFLFKYRGGYYAMQMPCGVLNTGDGDPDEAAILE